MFKTLAGSTHEKYNTPTGVTLHSKYFSLCHPSMLSSLHYPALTLVSLFLVYFGNNYKSKFHKTVRISRHSSTEEGPQPTLSVPRLLPGGGHGHSCLAWPLLPWALLIPLWVNPALGTLWEAAWDPALQQERSVQHLLLANILKTTYEDDRATSGWRQDPPQAPVLFSYQLYHVYMQLHTTYLRLILALVIQLKQNQTKTTLVGPLSHLGTRVICDSEAEGDPFSVFIKRI